mgnify:CR=1 FL=1
MVGSPRAAPAAIDTKWDLVLSALTCSSGDTWNDEMPATLCTLCSVARVSQAFRSFLLRDRSLVAVVYRRCVGIAANYKTESFVEGYRIAQAIAGGVWEIAHASRVAPLRIASQLLWGAPRRVQCNGERSAWPWPGCTVWRPPRGMRALVCVREHESTATKAGFNALRELIGLIAACDTRDWRLQLCVSSGVSVGYARCGEIIREVITEMAPSRIELRSTVRPPMPPSVDNPICESMFTCLKHEYEMLRTWHADEVSLAVARLVAKTLVFIVKYDTPGHRRMVAWRVGPSEVYERRVIRTRK